MKYRKKPVVIEAIQMGSMDMPKWFTEALKKGRNEVGGVWGTELGGPQVFVNTLEGPLKISEGDWIIRGVQGELYPCKPDIFEATYECVENDRTKPIAGGWL